MLRFLRVSIPLFLGVLCVSLATSQEGKKYSVKSAQAPVPKEISAEIAKLLSDSSTQFLDSSGKVLCEFWLRKEIPADATDAQLKTGVTWREVKQTEILGAIQFHQKMTDYRKQPMKPGVYTMRLAYQPTDGKHTADVADYHEFALVIAAKADTKAALMEAKALHDKSGDSLDLAHPGVFMLWPNPKPATEPTVDARPKNHWVANSLATISVGGKATSAKIGVGLTLIGHSPAEE